MLYEAEWKQIPVPTFEQTARFAEHVANNHSWYKHLPFFPPGASFIFFPNPYAGFGVKPNGHSFTIYEIEQGNYFSHHSRLSTAEYFAQFGYWDYSVAVNPRVHIEQPGPWLYSTDGSCQLLADTLKKQWSCWLTAFAKPMPGMFSLSEKAFKREADAFLASGARSHPGHLLRCSGVLRRRHSDAPAVERYLSLAKRLRSASTLEYDQESIEFMKAEMRVQRESLLATLHRILAEWSA